MKKTIAIWVCMGLLLAAPAWCDGMKPKAFKKKIITFSERVIDGQSFDFVKAKGELIEDLYRTSYMQDLQSKYEELRWTSRGLLFGIEERCAASKDEADFKATKDRYAEWLDFCGMADRAPEDINKEIIQEYLMDKSRKGQPPFEITSAKWEPEEQSGDDIDAYKKELSKAEKAVKKILSALKSKDQEGFAAFFPEKLQYMRKGEPETSEINQLFKRESDEFWQDGMSSEIAPMYLRADLEEAANEYKNKNVIKTVVRRWNGKQAKLSALYLAKVDGKNYIIQDWPSGSFDMQYRRY
jgi:hypothetical protein